MSARRASIAQVMIVVAMAAANLALFREMPVQITAYPTIWVLMGSIDFVCFWKVVLKRSLRAFHYSFLIVFVVVFVLLANWVASGRFRLLGSLFRWYQQVTEANTIGISLGLLDIGEYWMACLLSFALACAIGLVATSLERRRNWDIAAFWRGALAGFAIFALAAWVYDMVWWAGQPSFDHVIARFMIMGFCMIVGGRVGLSRLRSNFPGRVTPSVKSELPQ